MNKTLIATCMGLLLAVSTLTPAYAESRPANTNAMTTDVPEPTKQDTNDKGHDKLVAECNEDGGGMMSGNDRRYHCVDAQGNDIW